MEEERCALAVKFQNSIRRPGGGDPICCLELAGLPREPDLEEIVDLALRGIS